MLRHFAFFWQDTGAYIREWKGWVAAPTLPAWVRGAQREQALIVWATHVSGGEPGEIGLDVTQFNWPEGDFRWSHYDVVDAALVMIEPHRFIQVSPAQAVVDVNNESARPVRSTPEKLVLDITGTPIEALYGQFLGRLVRRHGQLFLEPTQVFLEPTQAIQRHLTEAPLTGALAEVAREMVVT